MTTLLKALKAACSKKLYQNLRLARDLDAAIAVIRRLNNLFAFSDTFHIRFLDKRLLHYLDARERKYFFDNDAAGFYQERLRNRPRFFCNFFSRPPAEPYLHKLWNLAARKISYLLAIPVKSDRLLWCIEVRGEHLAVFLINVLIACKIAANFRHGWERVRLESKLNFRERQIKAMFDIAKEPEVDILLQRIVRTAPDLLLSEFCSIFLLPYFLPKKIKIAAATQNEIHRAMDHVVVLAATKGIEEYLPNDWESNAYYWCGDHKYEGITGWVANTGAAINVRNITDHSEVEAAARQACESRGISYEEKPIKWAHKYNEGEMDTKTPRPFLAVPIIAPKTSQVIGVLRAATIEWAEDFSKNDEVILQGFAELLGAILEREYIADSLQTIFSAKKTENVEAMIVDRASRLLFGAGSSIFLKVRTNEHRIVLTASTSKCPPEEYRLHVYHRRAKGCTAWVYTTGNPLLIDDIQNQQLLDEYHAKFPGSPRLEWSKGKYQCETENPGPFIAAPIIVFDKIIYGAIRVVRERTKPPFKQSDLEVLEALARQVALEVEHRMIVERTTETEQWQQIAGSIAHSFGNYTQGIDGELGAFINEFREDYQRGSLHCSFRAEGDFKKLFEMIETCKKWNEYIRDYAKFFESFTQEAQRYRIKHAHKPAEVHAIEVLPFLKEIHLQVIEIEKRRQGAGELLFKAYNVAFKTNGITRDKIYYHDPIPLRFIFYELLKNAYLKLYASYGQYEMPNLKPRTIDVILDFMPANPEKQNFDRLRIRVQNECPYREPNIEIFQDLRAGIRPRTMHGTGLGILCGSRFVRGYYCGKLVPFLRKPYARKGETEGAAVFSLIIPFNIVEALRWEDQQDNQSAYDVYMHRYLGGHHVTTPSY